MNFISVFSGLMFIVLLLSPLMFRFRDKFCAKKNWVGTKIKCQSFCLLHVRSCLFGIVFIDLASDQGVPYSTPELGA